MDALEKIYIRVVAFPPEVRVALITFVEKFFAACAEHRTLIPETVVKDYCGRSMLDALVQIGWLDPDASPEEITEVMLPYAENYASQICDLGLRLFEICYEQERAKGFAFRSVYSRVNDHLKPGGSIDRFFANAAMDPSVRTWPHGYDSLADYSKRRKTKTV